ncbi:hypothetical protein FSP39_019442 [Pinctada imbricata]|uniref:PPM-type phosphatase domain-containing protein n=1 Tax=Pinctada imbricata TaxID=66713 RepID=A0AA88XLI6_PINIB|nr:hypothetical protein FSP39_019442 [Pinctada imbricata]
MRNIPHFLQRLSYTRQTWIRQKLQFGWQCSSHHCLIWQSRCIHDKSDGPGTDSAETKNSATKSTVEELTLDNDAEKDSVAMVTGGHLTDPENTGKRQAGVNFDTLGSWNNRISMPIAMNESIKLGKLIPKIPLEKVGTASLIGRRKYNEDRFIVSQLSKQVLVFGIFDGHGGQLAAEYVSNHMTDHLTYWLQRSNDLQEILWNSFIDINNMLTRHLNYYSIGSEDYNSGTTATVCLLRDGIDLTVGHVGDTRAILCREGLPIRLTVDHHPDNHTEKSRVLNKGGRVTTNSLGVHQVNSRLAMTRSIGDVELKQHGVISEPYLRSIRLRHGMDSFLILTTDGLNFVLSDQEVMDIVCSCPTPSQAASFITDQALQFGTEDNTTTVIIPLGAWGKYRTNRAIPYSFGRNLVGGRFG